MDKMQQFQFAEEQILGVLSKGLLDVDKTSECPAEDATKNWPPKNIVKSVGTSLQSEHSSLEFYQNSYQLLRVKTPMR
jgi:hypothetical protein